MAPVKSSQIKGLPVMSIAEGTVFGKIADVYVDVDSRMLLGFVIDGVSGSSSESTYLDPADIRSVGADAVMVDNLSAMGGETVRAQVGALVPMDALLKRDVMTEGGVKLGAVANVEFDPASFAFTDIEVSPGHFKTNTTIGIAQVTSIGPEVVIVSDTVVAEATPDEVEPSA